MSKQGKKTPEVRYSIVRKLSSRLFSRLFGIFLSLDILICLLTACALLAYSEQAVSAAWEAGASPASGVTVEPAADEPEGFAVMAPFSLLLPDNTRSGLRSVELGDAAGRFHFRQLDSFTYSVSLTDGISTYRVSVGLGTFFHFFRYAFIALLACELLMLLSQLPKDRKIVRRTLDPISELAEAAKSLNRTGNQFDPAKMEALAGKLEGINAARLDTRIPVDETQEELKPLAMSINDMLDRINASYRAQVRFVSDASHELRTPISVIQGYANLLDRWGKNDEKTLQESINAIKGEAANMKELVEQLLFLARGDNNTIALQLEEFSLSELAGEVIRETQLIDTAHRFEVRGIEVGVNADRSLVKQALRILVDNAIKYTDAGGTILVSVEREADFARLSVTDDGIGIAPDAVPQIFERVYRADESRARATGGAGLGLSIAQWIATRHGGHMEVLSRVGIGTKVLLALPVSPVSPEKAAP